MDALQTFLFAFAFSFVGSIPPATLNVSVLQLGLAGKMNIAWRFSVAAAIVEYPYAWIAIVFEEFLTASPIVEDNFRLITALVMLTLGVFNIWSAQRPSKFAARFEASGFRRGLVLSILNPLAMPYWLAMTAYMKAQGWITLDTDTELHAYLTGIVIGAFLLLILLAFAARNVVRFFQPSSWTKQIPGVVLLILGVYAMIQYFL